MSPLQYLQGITLELDITSEVHFLEGLHRYFVPSTIPNTVRLLFESEIVLDGSTGALHFSILWWCKAGG